MKPAPSRVQEGHTCPLAVNGATPSHAPSWRERPPRRPMKTALPPTPRQARVPHHPSSRSRQLELSCIWRTLVLAGPWRAPRKRENTLPSLLKS